MSTRRRFIQIASSTLAAGLMPLASRDEAQAQGGKPPMRMLTFPDWHGMHGDHSESWIRDGDSTYALKPEDLGWALQPFAPHIDKLTVISNSSSLSRAVLGGGPAHFSVNAHCLTGSQGNGGRNNVSHNHPSIDAHMGEFLSKEYGLPSPRALSHVAIGGSFSYQLSGAPARSLGGPQAVFESVFAGGGGVGNEGGSNTPLKAQQLVVEEVRKQLQVIRPQLTQANASMVMDAYQTSLKSVLDELQVRGTQSCDAQGRDRWPGGDSEAGITATFDAIYQMFACDLVSSVKYSTGQTMSYSFVGDKQYIKDILGNEAGQVKQGNYHRVSHNTNAVAGRVQGACHRWRNGLFADLVDRLSQTQDVAGFGSVMDNTVIWFTAAMSHNTHKTDGSIPTFILAGKNTNFKGGMHIDARRGNTNGSSNEVMVTLAQGMYQPLQVFGGHKGGGYNNGAEGRINRGPLEAALKGVL